MDIKITDKKLEALLIEKLWADTTPEARRTVMDGLLWKVSQAFTPDEEVAAEMVDEAIRLRLMGQPWMDEALKAAQGRIEPALDKYFLEWFEEQSPALTKKLESQATARLDVSYLWDCFRKTSNLDAVFMEVFREEARAHVKMLIKRNDKALEKQALRELEVAPAKDKG